MKPNFSSNRRYRLSLIRCLSIILLFGMVFPSAGLASPGASGVTAIGTPTSLSPANHAVIHWTEDSPVAIPLFSWDAVSSADRYEIQFSQSIDFSQSPFGATTYLTQYLPIDRNRFVDGNWYWHVRAFDAENQAGSWTDAYHFVKEWAAADNQPALTSPVDGAQLDFFDSPAFSWSAVPGANRYELQIDLNQSGFNPPPYSYETLKTTFQPKEKFANGTYYWRVVPMVINPRDGQPSEVRSFTMSYGVGNNTAEIPVLIEPLDDSLPILTPTFRWTAVVGAEKYLLQYSTDPTFASNRVDVSTRNTSYTPQATLGNDVDYYWRVQAISGKSESAFSTVWNFRKRWDIQPVLLTPTNLFMYVRFPFFSWTPVPGAAYYRIEVDYDDDFNNPFINKTDISNTYYHPDTYYGGCDGNCYRYWRVTPYDGSGKPGVPSLTGSFQSFQENVAPDLVYPLYYFDPSMKIHPGEPDMNPRTDRSIAIPIFIWNRLTWPYPSGGSMANAYRIEVSQDPLFASVDWDFDTENTSAAPTWDDNFTREIGVDYYWRVARLDQIGGAAQLPWSQVWRTQFTSTLGLTETPISDPPVLLRPGHGSETVEATPLMEWLPVENAINYTVQVSRDPDFATGYTVIDTTVPYPAFSSPESLAQRLLDKLDFGTFHWRVQATDGVFTTPWSETSRFQIASQSEWALNREPLQAENRLPIALDAAGDTADPTYDLVDLNVAQDNTYWNIGFHYSGTLAMSYGLYIDLDHEDGSGANTSPAGRPSVPAIAAHLPEYAVYINKAEGGVFSADQVVIYPWFAKKVGNKILSLGWGTPYSLASSGGTLAYDPAEHYVELRFPNTSIGHGEVTGSYAMALFSIGSNTVQDSVPASPEATLSRFASVSERMNLIYPPNHTALDPTSSPVVQPFFFDHPTGHRYSEEFTTSPWAGLKIEVYLDPSYSSTKVGEVTIKSTGEYYADNWHTWLFDLIGDNTYYWRAKPRYLVEDVEYYGAWTQGSYIHDPLEARWSFVRKGFVPTNLHISVDFATPTFTWDMVEGAERYEIQVAYDSEFNEMVGGFPAQTRQTSFTPANALKNAHYYWRVRTIRKGDIFSDFSGSMEFDLALPVSENLRPDDPEDPPPPVVWQDVPTLCWDKLIRTSPTDGYPVMSAWRYRVQASKNPLIPSNELVINDVTEQNCFTWWNGLDDGIYYWHVAMLDGNGNQSDFSPVADFTKQYPKATLLAPSDGMVHETTPVFHWMLEAVEPFEAPPAVEYFRIEVSKNSEFTEIYDSATTPNMTYVPTKIYDRNHAYWWRVAMIDRNGRWGPYQNAEVYVGLGMKTYVPVILKKAP